MFNILILINLCSFVFATEKINTIEILKHNIPHLEKSTWSKNISQTVTQVTNSNWYQYFEIDEIIYLGIIEYELDKDKDNIDKIFKRINNYKPLSSLPTKNAPHGTQFKLNNTNINGQHKIFSSLTTLVSLLDYHEHKIKSFKGAIVSYDLKKKKCIYYVNDDIKNKCLATSPCEVNSTKEKTTSIICDIPNYGHAYFNL